VAAHGVHAAGGVQRQAVVLAAADLRDGLALEGGDDDGLELGVCVAHTNLVVVIEAAGVDIPSGGASSKGVFLAGPNRIKRDQLSSHTNPHNLRHQLRLLSH